MYWLEPGGSNGVISGRVAVPVAPGHTFSVPSIETPSDAALGTVSVMHRRHRVRVGVAPGVGRVLADVRLLHHVVPLAAREGVVLAGQRRVASRRAAARASPGRWSPRGPAGVERVLADGDVELVQVRARLDREEHELEERVARVRRQRVVHRLRRASRARSSRRRRVRPRGSSPGCTSSAPGARACGGRCTSCTSSAGRRSSPRASRRTAARPTGGRTRAAASAGHASGFHA